MIPKQKSVITTVKRRLGGFSHHIASLLVVYVSMAAENLIVWQEKSPPIRYPPVINTGSKSDNDGDYHTGKGEQQGIRDVGQNLVQYGLLIAVFVICFCSKCGLLDFKIINCD